jgi:hypothetical protein
VHRRLAQIIALTPPGRRHLNRGNLGRVRVTALAGVDMLDWRRIEEAPFEEDVELFVTDLCGSYYPLRDTWRCTAEGWVSSATGAPLNVTPVMWKPLPRT